MKRTVFSVRKQQVTKNTLWREKNAGGRRFTLVVIVLLLCISIVLTGCEPDMSLYRGDYPEAFTIAENSVIALSSPFFLNIWPVEGDDHGRIIYLCEDNDYFTENSLRITILMAQKIDGNVVYCYPDYNFISFRFEGNVSGLSGENRFFEYQKTLPDEYLERLKDWNDWNKSFDEDKCISFYTIYKESRGLLKESQIREFYSKIVPVNEERVYYSYLTSDAHSRQMYFVYEGGIDKSRFHYLMLFNPDGTYDLTTGYMEVTDFYDYQDALRSFKEQSHWNEPL